MQKNNTIKFVKRFFKNKYFISTVILTLVTLVIILAIGLAAVWHWRASLFGNFAKEYLRETTAQLQGAPTLGTNTNGDVQSVTEKVIEKQSVIAEQSLVINAVKKTNPSVVSIIISKEVPKYETYIDPNQQNNPFGDMFPGFNLSVPQYRQNGTEKKDIGGGSGFFVSNDGLIVTNKHVVDRTGVFYTVFTNDGKKHDARVIARDSVLDIALIKIDAAGYTPLSLGDSSQLEVGQSVIAIGNSLGEFRNTVSVGVVSGLARSVTAGDSSGKSELLDKVIQTDAAINSGNSGGPLLDLMGRVIGVNVAIVQGSQNIGFALPINSVKGAIESVKSTGKIVRPYIGIRFVLINAKMKSTNNLPVDYGILVKAGTDTNELAVIPGSPADKAGIVENDIILEIDGVKVDDKTNFASLIREKKIGDIINLKILHKGVEKMVQVTLEVAKDN